MSGLISLQTTTPPAYPGTALVGDLNIAMLKLATFFAGDEPPTAVALGIASLANVGWLNTSGSVSGTLYVRTSDDEAWVPVGAGGTPGEQGPPGPSATGFNPRYYGVSGVAQAITVNYGINVDQFLWTATDITLLSVSGMADGGVARIAVVQDNNGSHNVTLDPTWVENPDRPPVITLDPNTASILQVSYVSGVYTVSQGDPYVPDYTFYMPYTGGVFTGGIVVPNQGLAIRAPNSQFSLFFRPMSPQTADRTLSVQTSDRDLNLDFTLALGTIKITDQANNITKQTQTPLMQDALDLYKRRVTSNFVRTNDNNLGAVSGLTVGGLTSGTYHFRAWLQLTIAASGAGHKYSIDSSDPAASGIIYTVTPEDLSTGVNLIPGRGTALRTPFAYTSGTSLETVIEGTLSLPTSGNQNIQILFSQTNASGASSTILAGSVIYVDKLV